MPEEIKEHDLVRVLADGEYKGQMCQVLYIEHGTTRRRKYSDTWYLLDTRMAPHNWSKPAWFERHEIERVEMDSEAQG